jgi:hypothetical protein
MVEPRIKSSMTRFSFFFSWAIWWKYPLRKKILLPKSKIAILRFLTIFTEKWHFFDPPLEIAFFGYFSLFSRFSHIFAIFDIFGIFSYPPCTPLVIKFDKIMSPFFSVNRRHTSSSCDNIFFFNLMDASYNMHHTSSYKIIHHTSSYIMHHHTSYIIMHHHTSSYIMHHTSSYNIMHHTSYKTCIIHHTSYNIMHHTSYNMQNIQHTPCQSIPITTKSITCKAEILKHDWWHIRNFFAMSKSNHD